MSAAKNGNRVCVNCKHYYAAHRTAENEQQARPCVVPGCDCRSVTHLVATWVGYVRGSDPANGKDQCTFLVHRKQDPPEQGEEIVGHGKTGPARRDAALREYRRRQAEKEASRCTIKRQTLTDCEESGTSSGDG